MATHDYNIANASGSAVRQDLNNVLQAIVTNNSSDTEPGTTFSFQIWADTTADIIKIRNEANDAWIDWIRITGEPLIPDGTVALPAISFASETDSGIYRIGANEIGIATSGTERVSISDGATVFNEDGENTDFRIEGDTEPNLFFVDAGNDRVGIGSASPGSNLTVGGNPPTSGAIGAVGSAEGIALALSDNTNSSLYVRTASGGAVIGTDAGGAIRFATGGNTASEERARIDSSGRVLVGTDALSNIAALTPQVFIEGLSANTSALAIKANTDDTLGSFLALGKSRGTADGANTIVQDGDTLGEIRFAGADGTNLDSEGARIQAVVDGAPGADDLPTRLVFSTCADGASSPTERMRIRSDGHIGINHNGTTDQHVYVNGETGVVTALFAQGNGAGNSYAIQGYATNTANIAYGVYGSVAVSSTFASGGLLGYSINAVAYGIVGYWSGAAYWSFYGNGACGATGFVNVSDSRLKDVDSNLTGCLDKLANIQPVKYSWKENSQQRRSVGDGLEIGLLAQEVQAQFPELVSEMEWGEVNGSNPETLNEQLGTTLGVDYGRMTAVLIQALNEAKERIETLETKVAALEAA